MKTVRNLLTGLLLTMSFNASAYTSPGGCDWPKGNSHRADWNEDFGGWGEYWNWREYEAGTTGDYDNAVRNFLVEGCNVIGANYIVSGLNTGTVPAWKKSQWPDGSDVYNFKDFFRPESGFYIINTRLYVEAGNGEMGYLNSNQYPWCTDRLPHRSPFGGDGWNGGLKAAWLSVDDDMPYRMAYGDDVAEYMECDFSMRRHRYTDKWRVVAYLYEGLKNLNHECFAYSNLLEVRYFAKSIHTIGYECFMNSKMQRILIGEGVKYIDYNAFAGLGTIRIAQSLAVDPPACNDYGAFNNTKIDNLTLEVPVGSINKYWHSRHFHGFGRFKDNKDNYYAEPEEWNLSRLKDGVLTPLGTPTTDYTKTGKAMTFTNSTLQFPGTQEVYVGSVYPPIAKQTGKVWTLNYGSGPNGSSMSIKSGEKDTCYFTAGRRGNHSILFAEPVVGNIVKYTKHTIFVKGDTVSTINAFTLNGFYEDTYPDTLDRSIEFSYFDSVPTVTISKDNEWANPIYELASPLNVGGNTLAITGIAEDPDYTTPYRYNVIRKPLIMQNISLSAGELHYAFTPEQTRYSVILDDSIESITYTAECNDPLGTVMNTGTHYYDYGTNEPDTIWIKGPNNETTRYLPYVFTVYRTFNRDPSLKSLTSSIPISFDKNILEHSAEVEFGIDSINIEAETTHPLATITSGLGQYHLEVGDNTFQINVTAHNGSTKRTYTLNVKRLKDTDATLRSLTVDTFALNPEFNPATPKYYVTVPNEVSAVTVKAEGNGYVSYISGTGKILLNVGFQQIPVTVHAMDGSKLIYRLNVTREAPYTPEEPTGIAEIEQDLPVDVFTLTGVHLGRHKVSSLNALKRHKAVILKTPNNVLKVIIK